MTTKRNTWKNKQTFSDFLKSPCLRQGLPQVVFQTNSLSRHIEIREIPQGDPLALSYPACISNSTSLPTLCFVQENSAFGQNVLKWIELM